MSRPLAQLRQLIDEQDIEKIQLFIQNNPNLNFNRISANGASALWWALMPPKGSIISKEIVELLVNYCRDNGERLLSPVQLFMGITPRRYLWLIDRDDFKAAKEVISRAENTYEAPLTQGGNSQHALKDFANDRQSAHNSLVTGLSRENIIRLHAHYIKQKNIQLTPQLLELIHQEIITCLSSAKLSQEQAEQMRFGLNFCFRNGIVFSFEPLNAPKENEFGLTLAELLALNWLAAKETNLELIPMGADDNEGLYSRQQAVFNLLFDVATAYGLNHPSCAGGACNRLGMCLAALHHLVDAYPKGQSIKGDAAHIIILRVLATQLENLHNSKPNQYLAVIRFVTLNDNDEKDKTLYQSFIKTIKPLVTKQLTENEGIDEETLTQFFNGLEDEDFPAYPLNGHALSHYLETLMLNFLASQFDLRLFYQNLAPEELARLSKQKIIEQLAQSQAFQTLLSTQGITAVEFCHLECEQLFLKLWLERVRFENTNTNLHAFVMGKENVDTHRFVLDTLLLTLFLNKKDALKCSHPKQALWADSLSHKSIIKLMTAINEDYPHWHNLNESELIKVLLLEAIKQGITANLCLENMHFKDLDLRAWNLSRVNFNGATLENCLLPPFGTNIQCDQVKLLSCSLTGIDNQASIEESSQFFRQLCTLDTPPSSLSTQYFLQHSKSAQILSATSDGYTVLLQALLLGHTKPAKAIVKSKHCTPAILGVSKGYTGNALTLAAKKDFVDIVNAILDSEHCNSSLFETLDSQVPPALHQAAKNDNAEVVKSLLSSRFCSTEFLEMTTRYGNTALMKAANSGATECMKLLIESPFCSSALLEKSNNAGETALLLAGKGHPIESFNVILSSPHCTSALLEKADDYGTTPFGQAVWQERADIVMALLSSKHCTLKVLKKFNVPEGNAAGFIEKHPQLTQEIKRHTAYLEIWEGQKELGEKITAILKVCCQGKSSDLLTQGFFNTDNQTSASLHDLLDTYQSGKIDSFTLLNEVKSSLNLNDETPLIKCIQFIESRIFHDKRSITQRLSEKPELSASTMKT